MEGLRTITQPSQMLDCGNGESYELRPLNLRDWATMDEEALARYKRDLISTWTRNADLLPAEMREKCIMEAFNRAEKVTTADVEVDGKVPELNDDGEPVIDPSTGAFKMVEGKVSYGQYWMRTFAGKLHSCWLSIRKANPHITLDQAAEIFQKAGIAKLVEASRAVAELSSSKLKNGSAADAKEAAAV